MISSKPLEMRTARSVGGVVTPPGSKSYTNRVFLIGCLAQGDSHIVDPLFSDDTLYMLSALKYLGFKLSQDTSGCCANVQGSAGTVPWDTARLYVGNAGTAMRFLTALLCLGNGSYVIDGDPRMRQRPLDDLVAALRPLGPNIAYLMNPGCPPLEISGGPVRGGEVTVGGSVSSQFVSALLMTGRCMERGLTIQVEGELASKPYIDLTIDAMKAFGAEVENQDYSLFRVDGKGYRGTRYVVESDASAATYFFAAAAIHGSRIEVRGLSSDSCQGDVGFADLLAEMGCAVEKGDSSIAVEGATLRGIDVDANAMPDVVPSLAIVALFAEGPTTIRNVPNLRVKESDRIRALAVQLAKIGARVDEEPDGLTIHPPPHPTGAFIETYNDHRIAMAFSVLGTAVPGIVIENPACVTKTYPEFFRDLHEICKT